MPSPGELSHPSLHTCSVLVCGDQLSDVVCKGLVPLPELPRITSMVSAVELLLLPWPAPLPYKCISGQDLLMRILCAKLSLRSFFQGSQSGGQDGSWHTVRPILSANVITFLIIKICNISDTLESVVLSCYELNCDAPPKKHLQILH